MEIAIRTRYGLYKYLVMLYGLTNLWSMFQNTINTILREFLHKGVVVYIDDILIYSKHHRVQEDLVSAVLDGMFNKRLAAELDSETLISIELISGYM